METFTSQQVIDRLKERYRLYNFGSKKELIGGLTLEQHEVIGDVMTALGHSRNMGARVGRSYPKTVNA